MPEKPLDLAGIHPPVPTFFTEAGDLDLPTLRQHIQRLILPDRLSIAGIVALGPMVKLPISMTRNASRSSKLFGRQHLRHCLSSQVPARGDQI